MTDIITDTSFLPDDYAGTVLKASAARLLKARLPVPDLWARWNEPHRRYHGPGHLAFMLDGVAKLSTFYGDSISLRDQTLLEIATWYHDIVYYPGAATGDNERDSANLMMRHMVNNSCSQEWGGAYDLVIVTVTHRAPSTFLQACLIDCDLAGLGAPLGSYIQAQRLVREEYFPEWREGTQLPDAWIAGRSAFLDTMLKRNQIYFTSWGAALHEQAVLNMSTERELLQNAQRTIEAERNG